MTVVAISDIASNASVINERVSIIADVAGVSSQAITDIAFGSGGTVSGNSNVALPVMPTEVAVNSLITASAGSGDYTFSYVIEQSPSPRIVFSVVIPPVSSINGQALSELALMMGVNTPSPNAFAIKRFPSISKSDTISILISWVIYIWFRFLLLGHRLELNIWK